MHLLKEPCWTSAGALDYEKTAKKLVSLETIDAVKRFKIACGHCLVDSSPVVWKELPEEYKSYLLNNRFISLEKDTLLQFYWGCVLNGEECELLETHIDFIVKILHPQQAEQMQVLRDLPGHLFRIFLHWPWQDLFLEKTDLIWNFLPAVSTYDDLLHHIRLKIRFSNYYFPELFQEFFRRSPSDFRKHFANQDCLGKTLFSEFLNNEDKESVKVILRNIDVEDRVRLVSCLGVFECIDSLFGWMDQNLVEL
ncbi:hypothetical protein AVEN_64205-1 [Araneus ventricosus]|uniref:Uncharacterized protein n=1 Tax=Araneus ventricosus TaxID=182803 RepID=A0A4Y2VXK4_ARAVE|nr:hypothetical protein AVEN_64205-1 [Araneus ventricosus]